MPAEAGVVRRQTRRGTRERHDQLLGLLRDGVTQVDELAAALSVSPSTVRRDLGRLNDARLVARTYGGAVVPETFHERSVGESALVRRSAKAAIATAAHPLVPAAGPVFVDAGTTCAALARLLVTQPPDGPVVTRGLETAMVLADSSSVDVIMLGGLIRPLSHGLVGPLTDLALDRLTFEAAFLGADAVAPERGVGEPTLEETMVKERVAANAKRVIVLADSTKLAVEAPAWAALPTGWTLVTDNDTPADLPDRCTAAGVNLIQAP